MGGASSPCQQYLYISTPSEIPINVTIKHIGGITQSNNVSNNEPWSYYIGTGDNTNLIINSANISSTPFSDKGFIIESEGLVYASARLFSCANDGISPGYQAAALVSKGNAALGTEFRAGNFEIPGEYFGGQGGAFLNFISVLAIQDNTNVDFSEFGPGVNITNATNITLNSGESYSIAIDPTPTSTNGDNATGLIGSLIQSNKPIAVNTGSFNGSNLDNVLYNAGGQDIGFDQIVPSEIIGNEYIFVRGLGPDEIERPLIVAHENDTEIYVNGLIYSTLQAGEFVFIDSTEYGESFSILNYDFPGNVNDNSYPPIPELTFDDEPAINQSLNMYINSNKPVFAYQVIGGLRSGSEGPFGTTGGEANIGLFYVPPINCKTPKSVNNIPAVNQIGDEEFSGIVTIVTEAGSDVIINGSDINSYGALPKIVDANPLYESYTIEGL